MSAVGDRVILATDAGSADTGESLTPCPSGDSSAARSAPMPPLSPPRPQRLHPQQQQPLPSLPNTPAPPTDRSPVVTPSTQPRQLADVWTPSLVSSEATGVVLGLEHLERQQDEAERRRREQRSAAATPPSHQSTPYMQSPQRTRRRYLDDDENTAPSSTLESQTRDAASHTGDTSLGSGDEASAQHKETTKFELMIHKTKMSIRKISSSSDFMRRRSSGEMEDPAEDDEEGGPVDAIIYGHLQKLGRNGKWQTRWFESDGECLSYYKSDKRTKLLATLDLEKVRFLFRLCNCLFVLAIIIFSLVRYGNTTGGRHCCQRGRS
jgi:hypothetical protein